MRPPRPIIQAGEIESLIIIGVYNTGEDRIEEYTPTVDPKLNKGGQAQMIMAASYSRNSSHILIINIERRATATRPDSAVHRSEACSRSIWE